MLDNLILGLTAALQLKQFLFMVAGTVIGLWVGVLPGLGGPVAMAILIPFTFSMDPLSALLMLESISVGAAFGGSITSILLNMPGEASSAATAYDGYPMAQRGKAKVAMGLSAGASLVAAIVGVLILMFASGQVAKAALAFSPAIACCRCSVCSGSSPSSSACGRNRRDLAAPAPRRLEPDRADARHRLRTPAR